MSSWSTIPSKALRQPTPFQVSIPEEQLSDIHKLLELSKIPPVTYESVQGDRKYGITHQWMTEAKQYWLNTFKWRECEKHMNSFPHFKLPVEDSNLNTTFDLHFVALFSARTDVIPLLLLHGWPGSVHTWDHALSLDRTDLCMLNYNITSTIGLPYSCAASSSTGIGLGYGKHKRQSGSGSTTPAQNGTISAQDVEVAQTILNGLYDSQGRRAYISYQPTADFEDAATAYDSATDSYVLDIASTGGEWVARFLKLQDADSLSNLDNVTYDTMVNWMVQGQTMYGDSLQCNNPDLTAIYNHGGKILHFHGESDPSVPTGSSVHYYESVRSIMYPSLSFNESTTSLQDWYRLFLVPGAAHCAANTEQPNGPFPRTNFAVMIDWVENGVVPETLNATHMAGVDEGQNAQICAWPSRPLWSRNGTVMDCVFDQASYDTRVYDFDAYGLPLY